MKNIFTLLFLLIYSNCFSQFSVDTIIDKNFYKSYFSNDLKNPIYVSTIIWKAGGNCDRSKFSFKNDITGIRSATLKDYANSGYDQGHLANAADWAFDCDKDEKTFRFYNALPQTPNLNRGIWKKWETNLRKISQNDSLLILSGGIFSKESKVIGDGVFVPDFCWKVVIKLKTNEVMNVLLFENDSDATVKEIKLSELEKLIGFKPSMNY
jgi:endonuclease G